MGQEFGNSSACGSGPGSLLRLLSENGCGLGHLKSFVSHTSGAWLGNPCSAGGWNRWGFLDISLHPYVVCQILSLAWWLRGCQTSSMLAQDLKECIPRENQVEADLPRLISLQDLCCVTFAFPWSKELQRSAQVQEQRTQTHLSMATVIVTLGDAHVG